MSTALATLPTSSDRNDWSPEQGALVEAAGLVATDAQSGAKTLAPRPVVAAFLQHSARTGLDPIARQIYCIARKQRGEYKWQIQISIDGARLVAERTGEYEGQTTPEFTGDGKNWTQVWLDSEPPKAARVGVYRRGFREPLYAVALWGAYAVYQDVWENGRKTDGQNLSAMWAKMGPLMLAKCAEMLALRKAFPQDLSGLYSTEEMDQAGAPREVVKQAEVGVKRTGEYSDADDSNEGPGYGPAPTQQAPIAPPVLTRDWAAEVSEVATLEAAGALYREAEGLGELGLVVGLAGDKDDGSAYTVMDLFWARRKEIEAAAAKTPAMVNVPKTATGQRLWVREARAKTMRHEVAELVKEATAKGAPVQVIDELESMARSLPDEEIAEPVKEWAVAEIPTDGAEWSVPEGVTETEF